jgi:hypothetical protein
MGFNNQQIMNPELVSCHDYLDGIVCIFVAKIHPLASRI